GEERLYVIYFLENGSEADFQRVLAAWNKAITIAHRDRSEDLFPNMYYSLKDLELDELLMRAARAFRVKAWEDCVSLLSQWRQEIPSEFYFSWRDTQVRLRL